VLPAGFISALELTLGSAFGLIMTSAILAWLAPGLRAGEKPLSREEMRKHTYLLFYCNPDDPRGLVPKLRGPGGTVNVRSHAAAWIMLVFTIGTVVGVVLTLIGALGLVRSATGR
jgi:uncharacterized membrane protein